MKTRYRISILALLLCLCTVFTGCESLSFRNSDDTGAETTTQAPAGDGTTKAPEETTSKKPQGNDQQTPSDDPSDDPKDDPTDDPTDDPAPTVPTLNGTELSKFSIVYSTDEPDYNKRAATYIRDAIAEQTDITLSIKTDRTTQTSHEIVVGESKRPISNALDADTKDNEFALLYSEGSVALEGDYFLIAAAAYYFVETYITGAIFEAELPETTAICTPITKTAKNYILLIGDGMGVCQTRLPEVMTAPTSGDSAYSDGESVFYGYYFPYGTMARTDSLSGTTDSAAAGTALATGYKTTNGRIGMDIDKNVLLSLTELAAQKGMATAVMSTEAFTGATPASFLAHAPSRNDTTDISQDVTAMFKEYGTIVRGAYNYYNTSGIESIENEINKTLTALSKNENGFFMMYEEAYIDKHCHSMDVQNAYYAVLRFNQAIGIFMEYACYHPETMVVITADHETSDMYKNGNAYVSSNGSHSSQYVPVFAWGADAACFESKLIIENVQIPKTIADLMGVENFGMEGYDSLVPHEN